jgi:hypothetical protein
MVDDQRHSSTSECKSKTTGESAMSWNLVKCLCVTFPLSFSLLGASQASAEVWGAVSISGNGTYRSVWNHSSSESAESDAQASCKRLAAGCDTTSVKGSGWIAGVGCYHTSSNRHRGLARPGSTAKHAIVNVYKAAIEDAFKKEDCKLGVLIAADGSHLKYKR